MRSLIISDVHANLAALEAVLKTEESWDEIICLGDTIVAGPYPNEVLDILREHRGIFVQGNHDIDVSRDLDALAPKGAAKQMIANVKRYRRKLMALMRPQQLTPDQAWYLWTCQQISEPNRAFLASFVQTATAERGPFNIRLIHGVVPDEWGYGSRIWPDSPDGLFERLAERYSEDIIVFGNSHVQFQKEIAGKTFINVGSVGQPRLGKPLAAHAVLKEQGFDLRSVPYDTEATAKGMDRIGLTDQTFVETWKQCYRNAELPAHYKIRGEWDSLKNDFV